jgi:hypothetical protein
VSQRRADKQARRRARKNRAASIPEREKVREAARMIADRARQVPEAHRPSLIRNTVRPLDRQRAEAITREAKRMLRENPNGGTAE